MNKKGPPTILLHNDYDVSGRQRVTRIVDQGAAFAKVPTPFEGRRGYYRLISASGTTGMARRCSLEYYPHFAFGGIGCPPVWLFCPNCPFFVKPPAWRVYSAGPA